MSDNNSTQNLQKLWANDDELFRLVRKELYTAVVGDIMDKLGFLNQFLPPQIMALSEDSFIVGRAMPVLQADVVSGSSKHNSVLNKPFGLMLEALDDLKKNEVYICSGASPNYALWGELMSARAIKLGAAGAIVDGYSRDTNGIRALKFPIFSYGSYAQDQVPRGKVIDFRVPINIKGVNVKPGDIVLGDVDGVCIIPGEAEEKIFTLALEKARGERMVLTKINEGMGAKEAFEKYGIM
ncbi:RraA family protein [Mucilaginibacter flavidus]|uniref:RraA family protein n=1 Tax=Mucilaginibacter flavidus TaxID=2949309 RepID=UPI002092DA11|nr:RraA family protein [Mucilaginibacter flavidus]MCO5948242.1 RraA family protein [Mucilaginibacter flavidus]